MDTVHLAGATNKIVTIRAFVASTGLPYTAGAFNTAGLVVHYTRDGATQQTITQVTAVAGTYTSSGFVHRGDGVYEIGVPTAALAAGADGVELSASGITDVTFSVSRIELAGIDPRSATIPDVNVTKVAGATQTAGDLAALINVIDDYIDTEIADIRNRLPAALSGGAIVATITGHTPQTGDTYAALTAAQAELAAVPAANASPLVKLAYIFTKTRNKGTQTATTQITRNDGDTGTIATATLSDDGTTFIKSKDV